MNDGEAAKLLAETTAHLNRECERTDYLQNQLNIAREATKNAIERAEQAEASLKEEHAKAAAIYGQSVKDACDEAITRYKHEAREAEKDRVAEHKAREETALALGAALQDLQASHAEVTKWRNMSQRHEENWQAACAQRDAAQRLLETANADVIRLSEEGIKLRDAYRTLTEDKSKLDNLAKKEADNAAHVEAVYRERIDGLKADRLRLAQALDYCEKRIASLESTGTAVQATVDSEAAAQCSRALAALASLKETHSSIVDMMFGFIERVIQMRDEAKADCVATAAREKRLVDELAAKRERVWKLSQRRIDYTDQCATAVGMWLELEKSQELRTMVGVDFRNAMELLRCMVVKDTQKL